jgi:hypothetical protein
MNRKKLYLAFICYAILGALAGFTLDGPFRLAVWIFLGGLAVKTWIAALRHEEEDSSDADAPRSL